MIGGKGLLRSWRMPAFETSKITLEMLGNLRLRQRLSTQEDPRIRGRALSGPVLGSSWRYWVGDYGLICDIDDGALRILVIELGYPSDITEIAAPRPRAVLAKGARRARERSSEIRPSRCKCSMPCRRPDLGQSRGQTHSRRQQRSPYRPQAQPRSSRCFAWRLATYLSAV